MMKVMLFFPSKKFNEGLELAADHLLHFMMNNFMLISFFDIKVTKARLASVGVEEPGREGEV
jgi:hypothetical protein